MVLVIKKMAPIMTICGMWGVVTVIFQLWMRPLGGSKSGDPRLMKIRIDDKPVNESIKI
jgi:hypothetical protein